MANKLTKKQKQTLLKIAKREFRLESFEEKKSGEDFFETAVWAVEAALEAAFLAGKAAAEKGA